jgi:predicted metal-dependent phosphoesterase TrpH
VKIDIHTHTRKCKSGDAQTREISPEDFRDAILSTEVRVVAITNHNVFDLPQFQAIQARVGADAQVWPSVELDVYDHGKGHLLVITSPKLRDAVLRRSNRSNNGPHARLVQGDDSGCSRSV